MPNPLRPYSARLRKLARRPEPHFTDGAIETWEEAPASTGPPSTPGSAPAASPARNGRGSRGSEEADAVMRAMVGHRPGPSAE